MTAVASKMEDLTIDVREEIYVRAPLDVTFKSLLEQLGPLNEVDTGRAMPMKLEAWPGGRWFRDLGEGNGHFWGTVQAIKRPTLLEICGPLFMSTPATSNLQYRLKEEKGGTLIAFHHGAFGIILEEYRKAKQGWAHTHALLVKHAEAGRPH
jgi:hypothetical protein